MTSRSSSRNPAPRERGASLLELIVVLALLGMITATVFQGVVAAGNAASGTEERLRNLDEARLLMDATTKDLRTAVRLGAGTSPFVLANGNEVIFYANLDTTSAPKKVRISIDGSDQLIEQVWNADAGSVAPNYTYTGTPRVRLVGKYVDNDAAHPLFTYLDSASVAITPLPLSSTAALGVNAVKIDLLVKKTSVRPLSVTELVNRVRLPNLDYDTVAG